MNPSTASPPRRRGPFARVARWSFRHRGRALALWVVALVAVTALSSAAGSGWVNDFALPGTESQRAADTLERHFPQQAGDTVQVVFEAPDGVESPPVRARVDGLLEELSGLDGVADVRSPYDHAEAVSEEGTIAYATVALDGTAEDMPREQIETIVDTALDADGDGLRVEAGGAPADLVTESEGGFAEGIGVLMALIVLFAVFGSLLAAATPIVTAVLAIGISTGIVTLLSHVLDVADYSPIIATLIGLGVGIDYALLVLSRYRSELHAGAAREDAVETALDTAGRTVFFAGCTVIIALLGLLALDMGSMTGPAVASAAAVLVTMVASLTLLPSLLAWAGRRIEPRRARRAAAAGDGAGSAAPVRHEGHRWEAWAAFVQRRPWPVAIATVALLLALAVPALDMRLGCADAGTQSEGKTTRQAYDLLAKGFGPGTAGPLLVVAELPSGEAAARELTDGLADRLAGTEGVATVAPATVSDDGAVATLIVIPRSAPQDAETAELLERVREEVVPPLAAEAGTRVDVGGREAAGADFADEIAAKMPLFVAIVVGLSALLLMTVFRSVLIPLKAAALNLLSIGAALGIVTLVIQEGVGGDLIGAGEGPIEAFIPVMMFAIVFGLSMDYEVFLLSRVHEEWTRSGDEQAAVRRGLASTGRVITAAAAIMVVVFASFIAMDDRMIKTFGLGLAVAILIDAVVIRCLLVPAIMSLLGRAAWWLPRWLDRLLPHVAIEREEIRR
ncbi:MMPL family transporter [Conexibacter arvalis]|uniref:RND superfamily putative drug exporter n=1 Tax=Conexibacter arvalis TaxID=912552 RepID=A0A840IAM7_9ACTN|nr:MMPL family transporter [Conexibacter arvalis]MBB4661949.1 RND superfamily putative drug exporter [Conexibacter arvalis]